MSARSDFIAAVGSAGMLQYKPGFSALKAKEGKNKISCADTRKLLGSVNIDDDCRTGYPHSNRWDYLIGVDSGSPSAHYVEVHSATSGNVSVMEKKLQWLMDFLQRHPQLRRIKAHYYWVASGKIKIPRHTSQYRRLKTTLRKKGLVGPLKSLVLKP